MIILSNDFFDTTDDLECTSQVMQEKAFLCDMIKYAKEEALREVKETCKQLESLSKSMRDKMNLYMGDGEEYETPLSKFVRLNGKVKMS